MTRLAEDACGGREGGTARGHVSGAAPGAGAGAGGGGGDSGCGGRGSDRPGASHGRMRGPFDRSGGGVGDVARAPTSGLKHRYPRQEGGGGEEGSPTWRLRWLPLWL